MSTPKLDYSLPVKCSAMKPGLALDSRNMAMQSDPCDGLNKHDDSKSCHENATRTNIIPMSHLMKHGSAAKMLKTK
jgi:hypothetical protein